MSYSISDLERISGIKTHTIRIWEKRYDLFEPDRSDGNHRKYSDEDVIKLLKVRSLSNAGMRISKIAMLGEDEMNKMLRQAESRSEELSMIDDDDVDKTVRMALELDEIGFHHQYNLLREHLSLEQIWMQLYVPAFNRISKLWLTKKLMPAQEHFMSALIRQKVIQEIDRLPLVVGDSPRIILFLPPKEHHEIGLLISEFMLKRREIPYLYLGANVPLENVQRCQELCDSQILLTYCQDIKMRKAFRQFIENSVRNGVEFILNGQLSHEDKRWLNDLHGVSMYSNLVDFAKKIDTQNIKVIA